MILAHYDDGKGKFQSHEITIKEDDNFCKKINGNYIQSHDITDIIAYGETKEEALNNLKIQIDYLMKEYKAFEKLLFETDNLTSNMVEVDCFGKEL